MNELEQDKQSLNFLARNFEKQKNERHFTPTFFSAEKNVGSEPAGNWSFKYIPDTAEE